MNVALTRSTLAAEGFPRRAFTVEDIRRMVDAGVIREDERIELIEGELVVMAVKSTAHDLIKNAFTMALARAVPDELFVSIESTIQLAPDILVEPDIAVVARSVYAEDRKVKARLYARHGIREFWVIDANERAAWIHTGPSGDAWTSIVERGPDETLMTPALPGFAIRLAEIG